MARRPRPDYTHTYHHIIVRGVDGLAIFNTDRKKERYVALMKDVHESHDLSVYAIGFLDNHVHQFVRRNQDEMGKFYRRVNGRFSQWYNHTFDRTGTLYDGRYFSVLVDSDAYFHSLWRYVHHQGVQVGWYERPEEDPWSSAGVYLGTSTRFTWIDWREAVETLGVGTGDPLKEMLTKEGKEAEWYEDNPPYRLQRGQRFLGGPKFVEQYMQIRKEKVRASQRQESPYEWSTLIQTAREISGLSKRELLNPSKSPERVKHRSGLAYAGRRFGHMTLADMADELSVSPPAVSTMIHRIKNHYPDLKEAWHRKLE